MDELLNAIEQDGYWTTDDLVSQELAVSLRNYAQKMYHAGHFSEAKIGRADSAQRVESIRTDSILWVDDWEITEELTKYQNILIDLQRELNQAFYLGLKRFEGHFAIYNPGAHYSKHLDVHKGDSHRSITFITYLSRSEGGELLIYDKDGVNVIKTISPQIGRTVIFKSANIYHEVRPAISTRFSLTGWFRRDLSL